MGLTSGLGAVALKIFSRMRKFEFELLATQDHQLEWNSILNLPDYYGCVNLEQSAPVLKQ